MLTLEVTDAFNGPLPPQTGEMFYPVSLRLLLFSTVRMHACSHALLISTATWVSEKREKRDYCMFLFSFLPTPQLSSPNSLHFVDKSYSVRCSVYLVSKPPITAPALGCAHFFSVAFFINDCVDAVPLHLKNPVGVVGVAQNLASCLQITVCEHNRSLLAMFRSEKFKRQPT